MSEAEPAEVVVLEPELSVPAWYQPVPGGPAYEQLPKLSKGQEEVFARLDVSHVGPPLKTSVRFYAAGYPLRESARLAGLKDHRETHRLATRIGLCGDLARLTQLAVGGARLGLERLEHELLDPMNDITIRDVAIVTGILVDKVHNAEKLRRVESEGFTSALTDLWERLREAGGSELSVQATLRVLTSKPAAEAAGVEMAELGPGVFGPVVAAESEDEPDPVMRP